MLGILRLLLAAGVLAGFTLTAAAAQSTAVRATGGTHVYLLRGLANVFSLGLDDLAEKLERRGVRTSVVNHAEADDVAGQIIARYRSGWRGPVVLVGHSLGADAVYPLAGRLAEANVPVPLIVSFDPVGFQTVPRNVGRAVNYYLSGCCNAVRPGPGFRGSLTNVDLEGKGDLGHLNIEKSPQLHADVIARVVGLSSKPRPTAAAQAPKPSSETTGSTPTSGNGAPPSAAQ